MLPNAERRVGLENRKRLTSLALHTSVRARANAKASNFGEGRLANGCRLSFKRSRQNFVDMCMHQLTDKADGWPVSCADSSRTMPFQLTVYLCVRSSNG